MEEYTQKILYAEAMKEITDFITQCDCAGCNLTLNLLESN